MSTYTVTMSAELMENYIHADILMPQDTFISLQTDTGASLLFSIDTDGVLNLTMEVPGSTQGWQLADLSSAQIKADFPNGAQCKTFGAAQTAGVQDGQAATIHLAMVINDGTNDHLYLSLGNSDSDQSWAKNPTWIACPFNAVDGTGAPIAPPSPFLIPGVFISEATDGEYIVADTVRNPSEPVGVLSRYYINVATPVAPVWTPHQFAADIQASGYQSCLGRTTQAFGVDGIYTMGVIATTAQLMYTPLYNALTPGMPPLPSRLNLPNSLTADAIAASRNADNTSDLYVAAQGSLYYFASTNQKDTAVATQLVTSPLLSGVRSLFAYAADGNVTVWGLNNSDEVFYTTCPQAQVSMESAWSMPIAIMLNVDAISPYVDRAYNANTFFAHGSNGLIKAVKTPSTGLWSQRNITLPPSSNTQAPVTVSSYTTHIQVLDASGLTASNVAVILTATSVTSVYINHLYYIVGPEPINVTTNQLGTVTIVETVTSLAGTRFTVVVDQNEPLAVNPVDAPFQRNTAYNSVSSLQGAVITNMDGTTRPLIPAGTTNDQLQAVAQSNQNLASAYSSVSSLPTTQRRVGAVTSTPSAAFAVAGFESAVETDVGDLFRWIESGVEAAINIVEDTATGLWHLVATIAGKIYSAVLDSVEAVVAAVTWVYNAIKVSIEDIIKFLEFLFEWQDIITTHNVLKNVFLQTAQYAIDGLQGAKAEIAAIFTQLQNDLNTWADIPGLDQTPGETAMSNLPSSSLTSAPSNLGVHHFQGNVELSSSSYAPSSVADAIFNDLVALLQNEETDVQNAFQQIKTQIIDQFSNLSLSEIIKRFIAIVGDLILQTAENIINTLIDVLSQLVAGLVDALNAKLDIPILSWLYNLLTGNDLSFLDLGCLIAAIPVTLIYKAVADSAPFPSSDPLTEGLLNATSFAQIQALFANTQSAPADASTQSAPADNRLMPMAKDSKPVLGQSQLKVFGLVTGVASLVGSVMLCTTSFIQKSLELLNVQPPPPFAKRMATISCVGNILAVSPNIVTLVNAKTQDAYGQLNNVLTGISIVKSMAAIPVADVENKVVQGAFPAVETFINVVWNVPVISNIVVNKGNVNTTYKSLIPESIGHFAFNLGGMLEGPIYIAEPSLSFKLAAGQDVLLLLYGVMMVVAGGIYEGAST